MKKNLCVRDTLGGVIIAEIIARRLPCGFGVIMPRKFSAPHSEELGRGAVIRDGTIYVNETTIKDLGISRQYIEKEKFRQLHEMTRRTSLYCLVREYLPIATKLIWLTGL
jgi:predicted phosphoribosyltransferase